MDFEAIQQADRRLAILQVLLAVMGNGAHEEMLRDSLRATKGKAVSRDLMRTELAWLAEQGLITVREIETLQIADLTARGADVANGFSIVPGVKRPTPGV